MHDKALPWYVIGVYYYAIKKYDTARKYFMKAFKFDRLLPVAYMGYAHSFAVMD